VKTTLTCSVAGASSTVSSQADDDLYHRLDGAKNNFAIAEVVVDSSAYRQGKLSCLIKLSIESGNETLPSGQAYTSSSAVQIQQTLLSSPAQSAQMVGEIVHVSGVENLGAQGAMLTLTIGKDSFECRSDSPSGPTKIPVRAQVSQERMDLSVNVSMQCNPGNEAVADGSAIFSISLQLVRSDMEPTEAGIPFIGQQYFVPKAVTAGQSFAAHP